MNREIKFRAWDKQNKIMRDLNVAYFGKNGYFLTDEGVDQVAPNRGLLPTNKISEFEIMQFTGLHDKNGKEIYEGDVVRLKQWQPQVYEVLFDRGGFCFRNQPDANFYHDAKYLEECEVIGNIYENPELITN